MAAAAANTPTVYLDAWHRETGRSYNSEMFELSWWHALAHYHCTYGTYYVVVQGDVQTSYERVSEGNAALGALRGLLRLR